MAPDVDLQSAERLWFSVVERRVFPQALPMAQDEAPKESTMKFEVLFRGENEDKLRAWKPAKQEPFAVSKIEAKLRYDVLVQAGLEGREIEGVVPYLVTIVSVEFKRREGTEIKITETMLFQYAEPEAYVSGQWAEIPRVA